MVHLLAGFSATRSEYHVSRSLYKKVANSLAKCQWLFWGTFFSTIPQLAISICKYKWKTLQWDVKQHYSPLKLQEFCHNILNIFTFMPLRTSLINFILESFNLIRATCSFLCLIEMNAFNGISSIITPTPVNKKN